MRLVGFKVLLLLLVWGCKTSKFAVEPLPMPTSIKISHTELNDSLQLDIANRLKSPVQVDIRSADLQVNDILSSYFPIVLQAEQDTILKLNVSPQEYPNLDFQAEFGDPQKEIDVSNIALPIPKNKKVRIIQGHNGSYSHNHDGSRYAIDFGLKINDTIFAASDGYVILAVDGYKLGGKDIRYLDFANKIVIYNPESGLYFGYTHLTFKGVFVRPGDRVKQGQPIGLVGMTGYTDVPHLHFNVSVPNPSGGGLLSVPVDFREGFRGKDLQKNVYIIRPN